MSAALISIFHKSKCNSGFISHLYHHELSHMYSEATLPRPVQYRLSPTSYLELPSGEKPKTTLYSSFQSTLNNLLITIQASQTHFILCLKPKQTIGSLFDPQFISTQCRALGILETCHMMAEGSLQLHRMKMTTFYAPYGILNKHRHIAEITTKCKQLISISLSRKYFS